MGALIFLALEPWAGEPGVGLGLLDPKLSLLNFHPLQVDVGPASSVFHVSAQLSVWEKMSPNFCLDARYFSSSLYAIGAFPAATLVLELRGSKSE